MNLKIGNLLLIDMSVKGTVWTQKITNRANGKSVYFDMDLEGQVQRWALFEIELAHSSNCLAEWCALNAVCSSRNTNYHSA